MKDANLIVTKAFPAAGAANAADSLDLGIRSSPGAHFPGDVEIEVSWPALAALVEAKKITITIQDSADNSSFTALPLTTSKAGATGGGLAAGNVRWRLPRDVRRYVNVAVAVEASGGDITAKSYTVALIVP